MVYKNDSYAFKVENTTFAAFIFCFIFFVVTFSFNRDFKSLRIFSFSFSSEMLCTVLNFRESFCNSSCKIFNAFSAFAPEHNTSKVHLTTPGETLAGCPILTISVSCLAYLSARLSIYLF